MITIRKTTPKPKPATSEKTAPKPAAQAIQKAPKPQPVQKKQRRQKLPRAPRSREKKQSSPSPYSIATPFIIQCKTALSGCRANATVIVQMNKATQITWKSERQDYKVSIRLEISLEKKNVTAMIAGKLEEFPLEKLGTRLKFMRNRFAAQQNKA